jgi:mono/diheme cytochrome c family protein
MVRVNRLFVVLLAGAIAGASIAGCAKSTSSSEGASATASGPITDVGSTGLKTSGTSGPIVADAKHGKEIFTSNCTSCHGATGTEGGVGPSLKNEKSRKNTDKTIAWIKNPQPPMPKLWPSPLSDKDVADVAAFVQSL